MYHQPSFRPQEAPRLSPPKAAVPVTGVERSYDGVDGKTLSNPIPRDQVSIGQGQILFTTNCAMCHGQQGQGNGPVASAYTPQPANLTGAGIQALSDGEIFLVITNGFSTMPSFRKVLVPDERWQVVNYVRGFGQKP
jgi:mono/diheme cytochrome c family protein